MKVKRMLSGSLIAFGLWGSQAQAQTAERYAAVDPSVAPVDAPPAGAVVSAPAATRSAPPAAGASQEAPPSATSTTESPAPTPGTPAAPTSGPPPAASLGEKPAPSPLGISTSAAPGPTTLASPTLGAPGSRSDAPEPSPHSALPIREQRKLALLGEVGWNSLGGWGLMMTYNAHPHLAFDLAGGFSMTGWKAGLRGRYNLLTGPFTPFVGGGVSVSSGWDDVRIGGRRDRDDDEHDDFDFDPKEEAKYDVKRSEFAQAVIGFEFIHRHGFTMQATAGYSWLLRKNNYTYVTGKRDDDLASALFGSGPVASLAFGYAFD